MKSLLEMELTDSPEFPYGMRKVFEKKSVSKAWTELKALRGLLSRGRTPGFSMDKAKLLASDVAASKAGKLPSPLTPSGWARVHTSWIPKNKSVKTAGFLETIERIAPKALVAGATAGLAGLATEAVVRGGEGLVNAVQKARAFKRVIAQNPDFQELDAHKVREQFDTIYQFSPSAAKSPTVAGSWMRMLNSQQLEGQQLIPTETIRDLVSIQQSISSTHPSMGKEVAKSLAAGMLKDTGGKRGGGGGGSRGMGAAISRAFAGERKKSVSIMKRLLSKKGK
jgi:hypothetical protein